MRTTQLGEDYCPNCHLLLDAASDPMGDAEPQPGDITLCVHCGCVLQFGNDLHLFVVTDSAVLTHPEVTRVVEAWKLTRFGYG